MVQVYGVIASRTETLDPLETRPDVVGRAEDDFLEEISDKEEDFIDRAINPRLESRLGCQCVILDDDAVIEVQIPDQSRIIGHEH